MLKSRRWHAATEAASPYGTIIRLLILTGQRRGEVAGMTWGEISDGLAIWTLPGERTKNGAAHTVPLSAPARDLVRALLPDHENKRGVNSGLLLPGALGTPFAGWSKAKRALDKAIIAARTKLPRQRAAVLTATQSPVLYFSRRSRS
jgi:integrase